MEFSPYLLSYQVEGGRGRVGLGRVGRLIGCQEVREEGGEGLEGIAELQCHKF